MTFTADKAIDPVINQFKQYDADIQLALLWYGYLDIKDQLHPAPPPAVTQPADAVYHQIQALSKEEQLQAQRDLANHTDTPISRAYGALNPNGKLQVWLSLAQGMEEGTIINLPENYELPSETQEFVNQIKGLNLEQRISVAMASVEQMGVYVG